jgi:bacterioferritin
MPDNDLIAKLNWFYSLELEQVDLYTAQSKTIEDIYLSKTLARVAVIEQQHVDNIAAEIRRRGSEPTRLGDVIAPLVGKAMGELTGLFGPQMILKADIDIEEKAMKDYKQAIIQEGKDPRIFTIFWDNLIDEDLHTAWFANKLTELAKVEQRHH